MHALFPSIVDVKYLCSTRGAADKTLKALYQHHNKSPSPSIVVEKFPANPVGGNGAGRATKRRARWPPKSHGRCRVRGK